MRILSTKKLPFAQRSRLLLPGVKYQEADFISINTLTFEFPKKADVFIFSSQNAVKSFLKNPLSGNFTHVPCWVVGQSTAEMLSENGFSIALKTDYADDLVQLIANTNKSQKVIFFAGNSRRNVIPTALNALQLDWEEYIVYEMQPSSVAFNGTFDAILFFSPSAVTSFLEKNELHQAHPICIGETTSAYFKNNNIPHSVAVKPLVPLVITETLRYLKKH
jgi:uroporphyrinogen-III synthase